MKSQEVEIVHTSSPILGKKHILNADEEELLALFNAWLDCERFSDEWTEEEQGILDETLMLIAKKQKRMEEMK